MNTMDSQVWLSVWHFMDVLGLSRHLLHQLSLGNPPDAADFYSLPGEEAKMFWSMDFPHYAVLTLLP